MCIIRTCSLVKGKSFRPFCLFCYYKLCFTDLEFSTCDISLYTNICNNDRGKAVDVKTD